MRIDSRPAQWAGAALIIGWVALLAVGIPRVAASIPAEEAVEAGQPVSAGGISVTPSAGWGAPKDAPGILILRRQGAQFTAFPPQPAAGDLAATLARSTDLIKGDASVDWQVGDPVEYTTADGLSGLYAAALSPQGFITTYVVIQDGQAYVVSVNGTDTDWTTLQDEILDMVRTLSIGGGAS